MQNAGILPSRHGLDQHGIRNIAIAYWNLGTAQLVEHAIRRHEGLLAAGGPLVVRTEPFTGRSPKDKFIVRDDVTETTVNWGQVNQPITEQNFERSMPRCWLSGRATNSMCRIASAAPIPPTRCPSASSPSPPGTPVRAPVVRPSRSAHYRSPCSGVHFDVRARFSCRSGCGRHQFGDRIIINFTRKVVMIAGTSYAGEMKKSVFTILNYLLPARSVLPMHCSANVGWRATWRCSSGSPERARRRFRPIRGAG